MRERLRQIQVRWPVAVLAVILAVGMMIVFIATGRNAAVNSRSVEKDKQTSLSITEQALAEEQSRLDSVGKNAYIEAEARKEGMIREGELIFHVENPEQLDCYTEAEWQRLTEERRVLTADLER